jgi:hypothetical protein
VHRRLPALIAPQTGSGGPPDGSPRCGGHCTGRNVTYLRDVAVASNIRERNPLASFRFGKRRITLPASRLARIAIGSVLVIAGILGFLPILGFWMVPLGLLVLSVDLPVVRRLRRRLEVWWGRRNDGDQDGQ